jgi:hypothetical protein
MAAEEFDRLLIGLQQRTAFSAFTIELQGGERFDVDQPAVAVRDGVAVYLGPGGTPIWFDHDGVK